MKKTFYSLLLFFLWVSLYSQTPQKFTYQSVVRNSSGNILKSAKIGIQLSIFKSSNEGTPVYSEEHSASTNQNGLVTLIIGEGLTSDNISAIDWSTGEYFLKVQVAPFGGINYLIETTSKLLSVPYALYAENSNIDLLLEGENYLTYSPNDLRLVLKKIDLSSNIKGTLPVESGGTGVRSIPMVGLIKAENAAAARTILGVDASGTGSTIVLTTVAENYLTISDSSASQELTAGIVPISLGGTGATDPASARTSLGLGTIATQDNDAVNIDGGAIDGTIIGGTSKSTGAFNTVSSGIYQSNGDSDVILKTGNTTTGNITIANGANGNINIQPDGTGQVIIDDLKFPAADGSANQVLTTDGSGNISFANSTDSSTDVTLATVTDNYLTISGQELTSGIVPISLGGTNSATAPMVGVITAADAAAAIEALGVNSTAAELNVLDGNSTLTTVTLASSDGIIINDSGVMKQVTLTSAQNYLLGSLSIDILSDALIEDFSMYIGNDPSGTTDTAQFNIAVGATALDAVTTGDKNIAVGYSALTVNQGGADNTAVGYQAGIANTSGQNNVFIGASSGLTNTTGEENIVIGTDADTGASGAINRIVIGDDATGVGDNKAVIGNDSITEVYMSEDAGATVYASGMAVVDESDLTIGNVAGDLYLKVAPSATVGNEDIRILNTYGTDEASVQVTSTAGGIDIDAAAAKDINIAGGQVALVSKDDAASAISLTTNQGTSETISITNTQGTDAAAVNITSTAGGIDIDAAAAKDINIAGGQVALVSKDDAASAISLTTNQGTSETISITNTQGTDAAAVNITSSAGGVAINSSSTTVSGTLSVTGNLSSTAGNIAGFDASLNAVASGNFSSNNYTLVASDNGKVITLDNGTTASTLTIPTGLGDGFNCLIVQKANHDTTITASAGTTLFNRSSEVITAGQYAIVTLVNIGSELYILSGDTK
jgi:hypothetical protein